MTCDMNGWMNIETYLYDCQCSKWEVQQFFNCQCFAQPTLSFGSLIVGEFTVGLLHLCIKPEREDMIAIVDS